MVNEFVKCEGIDPVLFANVLEYAQKAYRCTGKLLDA